MRGSQKLVLAAVLTSGGVSTDERLARLNALDLSMVRRKLMEPYPEGKGWNEAQAIEAEKWYKRYIASIIKYPDATQHVPNGPIDFFWHQHILDTMRYGDDCHHVLGYFLHHYPYFGLNGDAAERDTSFDDTNAIYREMYGEDCLKMAHFGPTPKGNECMEASLTGAECKRDGIPSMAGSGCNHGGSGTGCGQSCGRHVTAHNLTAERCGNGMSCNSSRSKENTGKAQGCGSSTCTSCKSGCRDTSNKVRCGGGPRRTQQVLAMAASNCNSGGSGTGCGQGCGRGK